MKTSSLDILEGSELPTSQARAILKVLEQEMASSQEHLATKADLNELRLATKADLNELRLATKADLNAMEGKLSRMLLQCFFGGVGLMAGAVYFLYAHPGR